MDPNPIHFELFVRQHRRAPWLLALASEDRAAVVEAADDAQATSPHVAVRVCKETLDPSTGDFRPLVLFERGLPPQRKPWRPARAPAARPAPAPRASCARPEDLYAPPARAVIGGALQDWLRRNGVTPFELLHRADLAERLEACEAELAAAVYNAAADAAAARGANVEPVRRTLATLVGHAIERLVRAAACGAQSPSLAAGMAIAEQLRGAGDWRTKVETLLDLIAEAEAAGSTAEIMRRRLQQPLAEALGGHGDLEAIFDVTGLGPQVLTLIEVAAPPAALAGARRNPFHRRKLPPLQGLAGRLAAELQASSLFMRTRRAMLANALVVLGGPARLWPADPVGEIEGAQTAFALLADCGRLIDADVVHAAAAARWRVLAGPGFIDQRLGMSRGALEDVDVLLDLIGEARGREAVDELGRRLCGVLGGETFMAETRFAPDSARLRLTMLASLRRRVAASPLPADLKADADFLILRISNLITADGAGLAGGPVLITHRGG